jgi:hypothetical protein
MPLIEVGDDLLRFIASEQAVRLRSAVIETDEGQDAAMLVANHEAGIGSSTVPHREAFALWS